MEKLNLRPTSFIEYVGQEKMITSLAVYVNAAKKRNHNLDHTIIYGPSGYGKTTLANIIANELESKIICTNGVNIQKVSDVISIMTTLEYGDILFIDEIHRIPKNIEEIIYSVMEDFRLDLIYGSGVEKQSLSIEINSFTLIGATTMYGKISEPLRNRFPINLQIQEYTQKEMLEIINRSCEILEVQMNENVKKEFIKASRNTPRIANNLLKRLRDFKIEFSLDNINIEKYYLIIEKIGINRNGLYNNEIKALQIISKNQPIGSDAIAKTLGVDKLTYENTIENYLIKYEYVSLTKQGRVVTQKTKNILKELSGN